MLTVTHEGSVVDPMHAPVRPSPIDRAVALLARCGQDVTARELGDELGLSEDETFILVDDIALAGLANVEVTHAPIVEDADPDLDTLWFRIIAPDDACV